MSSKQENVTYNDENKTICTAVFFFLISRSTMPNIHQDGSQDSYLKRQYHNH